MSGKIRIRLSNIQFFTTDDKGVAFTPISRLPKTAIWEPRKEDFERAIKEGWIEDFFSENGADYLSDKHGWYVRSFDWNLV